MTLTLRRAAMGRLLLFAVLPACLSACGLYHRPNADEREARSDCDAQADRIYAARHRDELSQGLRQTDSPYSANTLPSNPNAGLSDRYEQENLVDSCLTQKGVGGSANPSPEAPIKQ